MASPSKVLVIDTHRAENHAAVEALIDAALAAESASLVATDAEYARMFFQGQDADAVLVSLAPNGAGSAANVRAVSVSGDILLTDGVILAESSGGAVVMTLPLAATATNKIFTVKNIEDTSGVSIDGNGGELIDGSGSPVDITSLWDSITVISDGTAWFVI